MDVGTIFGLVAAFGLIVGAMAVGGGIGMFVNVPSILIVVLGTAAVLLVNFPMKEITQLGKIVMKTIFAKDLNASEHVDRLVKFGQLVRTEGILALEEASKGIDDEFFKKGLLLAIDGTETEQIVAQLESELDSLEDRHAKGVEILAAGGTTAPAMGLVGTLIGLVQMLQNMADPSAIGPAMAVALLTTFYGALLANIIFNPLAGKLRIRSKEEVLYNTLILVGIESISKGDNPRVIESRLNSLLAPKKRIQVFD
jgi:chemotaxis protein MotA